MRISGFTFARNASKLYYPVKSAIQSILPLVDEFIVALGDSDADDTTEQEIASIQSHKIKIVRTTWKLEEFPNGMEYARQTDIAKNLCTGDWLFYIQCDEVLHEKYHKVVQAACEKYLNDSEIEGLLFDFKHFWGDYRHYVLSHARYPREIRVIRNDAEIHSWRDAQSFRRIPAFDGRNYYQKKGTQKLKVALINAAIHHYGFVRPPEIMNAKNIRHRQNYRGQKHVTASSENKAVVFDYGDMDNLEPYIETQPRVMKEWIAKMNWQDQLKSGPGYKHTKHKHDKLKYKVLTFIEQHFLNGEQLFGFKNYNLVRREFFSLSDTQNNYPFTQTTSVITNRPETM
ncbi:MAG TPA: hypothetical protein VGK59_00990 [Ohtaekwangia sp.]